MMNRGESMIALLKLLAIINGRAEYLHLSDSEHINFDYNELWEPLTFAMKELIMNSTEDPAIEFVNNQGLAEYALK